MELFITNTNTNDLYDQDGTMVVDELFHEALHLVFLEQYQIPLVSSLSKMPFFFKPWNGLTTPVLMFRHASPATTCFLLSNVSGKAGDEVMCSLV